MEETTEGPDYQAKSFSLADLQWARREGVKQGVENALTLIDAGASAAYVREHLLSDAPAQVGCDCGLLLGDCLIHPEGQA